MLFSTDPVEVAANRAGRLSDRQRALVGAGRHRERRAIVKWAALSLVTAVGMAALVGLSGGYAGSDDVGRPAEIGGIPRSTVALAAAVMGGTVALWWIVFLVVSWAQNRSARRLDVLVSDGGVEIVGSVDAPSVLVRIGGSGGVSGFLHPDAARGLAGAGEVRMYYVGRRTMADFLSAEHPGAR